ncbi:hypothetical protein ACL02R_13665 [Streptomyces sp. MS19]|uniref:hypothetical protein n=1 Tax=Streptomyces sp. MS19 TaxID=3385972 RepID=UPI0039A29060
MPYAARKRREKWYAPAKPLRTAIARSVGQPLRRDGPRDPVRPRVAHRPRRRDDRRGQRGRTVPRRFRARHERAKQQPQRLPRVLPPAGRARPAHIERTSDHPASSNGPATGRKRTYACRVVPSGSQWNVSRMPGRTSRCVPGASGTASPPAVQVARPRRTRTNA